MNKQNWLFGGGELGGTLLQTGEGEDHLFRWILLLQMLVFVQYFEIPLVLREIL